VNRDTQSVLLVLVGGAIVRISIDDTFLRYVKDWMRPGLLAAGAVLVVLGLVSLWRERASRRRVHAAAVAGQGRDLGPDLGPGLDHDRHDHAEHGPWVAWLLVLPVLAILLVAPPALGSYSASRSSSAVAEPKESEYLPLPPGDPVTTTLTDYATRTIWDEGRSLEGRRIRLVGFVTPRPAGGFHLTRIVLMCCAADGLPIRVAVPDPPRTFPADTWVAVTGSYGGLDEAAAGTDQVPVLRAEAVALVPTPADPYE
jgi:uncharacterized repeat protein (TIGR03943 family)